MLNYTTKNITEFFKKIHLSLKNNEIISEINIIKALDVIKLNNKIKEKEIWPNAPTRLHLTTNYDNANVNKAKLPNSVYEGPILIPSNKSYINNPLVITVVPYPADAKWKLLHSDNIIDSEIFHKEYYGTQSLVIPLNDAIEEDISEYREIRAVSAIKNNQIEPAKFRFFVKHPSTENKLDISLPDYQWSFDTETPYFDIYSNKELSNYRNLSLAEDHIIPEINSDGSYSGCDKQGLRAVYYVDDRKGIYVNDIVYIRNISLDNELAEYSKFGWNNDIYGSVFTTSETPTKGDTVYNDKDTEITDTIVDDYFTVENNKWYCDLDVDVPIEDSDFTVAAYIKFKRGGYVGFINKESSTNFLESIGILWSYYTFSLFGTNEGRSYNNFNGNKIEELKHPITNDDGWTHMAISCSRQMSVTETLYNLTNGYGFKVDKCIFIVKKSGNSWLNINDPFIRDPSKDENGKYAFTWQQVGLSAQSQTYPDIGVEYNGTIWTASETPESWSSFYVNPNESVLNKNNYQMRNTVYRLTYRDDRYTDEYGNPFTKVWDNNKFGLSGEDSDPTANKPYARMVVGWAAGKMIGKTIYKYTKSSTAINSKFGIYLIPENQNTIVGSKTYDGVDDVCVYKRMYSDIEAANAAKKIDIVVNDDKKPKLDASYRNKYQPVKITVKDSNYLYDPDKTVYYSLEIPEEPGKYRELEVRYGWEKIDNNGTGPDALWTIVLTPAVNSKCYNDPNAITLDDNLVISDVVTIGTNETPLKGNILYPYVIDNKTIAIVIVTHEYIYKKVRTIFPDFEAISYNSENGYLKDYMLGYTVYCDLWETQQLYQPLINFEADKEENWKVNGQNVIIRDRWYTCAGLFRYYQPQYRNCKPYNSMYAKNSEWDFNGICGDYNQVVYLTLPEPMEEGSLQEITWCGNSCKFTYNSNQFTATIKINQEGYLPWDVKRYAYMGRWLGGTPYEPVIYIKTTDSLALANKEYYTYGKRQYTKINLNEGTNLSTYYDKPLDTIIDPTKEYFTKDQSTGNYIKVDLPKDSNITNYYEKFSFYEKTNIIPIEYHKTFDTILNENKEYYIKNGSIYELVTNPDNNNISNYYEKVDFYIVPTKNPDIEHCVYAGKMTLRAIARSSAGICSDRYGIGDSVVRNKPIYGENTYELDFSNFKYCIKNAIIINNTKYFRDELEDFIDGTITVDNLIYKRCTSKDTCNAYAWFNEDQNKILYTDTHIPTIEELSRDGYDDFDHTHLITAVNSYLLFGWTTERKEENDVENCITIWTRSETPNISDNAEFLDGSVQTINNYLTDQLTFDIFGNYQIYIPNIGWSMKFIISNQSLGHMYYIHSRGLFHQRSGCYDVKHPYTNWEYPGPAHEITYDGGFIFEEGQAKDASVNWQVNPLTHIPILTASKARIAMSDSGAAFNINTDQNKVKSTPLYDVHGGWFDAADFDMRVMHMDIISELANAYIRFPDNFTDNQVDIPESGDGIPDILSEAIWGAELYRKAQLENGGIRAWFETHRHENDWPWESNYKYYACAPSMRNSVRYAFSAARLARALKLAATKITNANGIKKCKELANLYTESACAAFEYGTKDFIEPYIKIPDSLRTPVYIVCKNNTYAWLEWISSYNNDDPNSSLKEYGGFVFVSACALYILTKENRFAKYINNTIAKKYCTLMDSNVNEYGYKIAWEAALDENIKEIFPDVYQTIRNYYINLADYWISNQEKNTYRMLQWKPGENNFQYCGYGVGHPDCRGSIILAAYIATKDNKYRNALLLAMDHVTGCNGLGRCWTTGIGKINPARHLDHWTPKHILRNDIWTPRPGISMYYSFEPYRLLWKSTLIAMQLKFEGRPDQNCPSIQIEAMPSLLAQRYYAKMNNARSSLGFPVVPFFSQEPLYDTEIINPGASEYTVWETIARKAVFTGCLMGKGFKPKFYYKQIAPKKSFKNSISNFAVLP